MFVIQYVCVYMYTNVIIIIIHTVCMYIHVWLMVRVYVCPYVCSHIILSSSYNDVLLGFCCFLCCSVQ